jgi:hypothetical protein
MKVFTSIPIRAVASQRITSTALNLSSNLVQFSIVMNKLAVLSKGAKSILRKEATFLFL